MEPIHIVVDKDMIAPIVLLPGDPLRAKYIAENFLTDYKLVNTVRNMFAYTGYYQNTRITIMGSGMGCPSVGIYAYELFQFYNVKSIIRIGSSGAMNKNIHPLDIVLSESCYSESSFAYQWNGVQDKLFKSSSKLNSIIKNTAKESNIKIQYGPTYTTDVFDIYTNIDHIINKCPIKDKLLCAEMEGFALLFIANCLKKEATVITTVVDSKFESVSISAIEREQSLNKMIKLALDSIIRVN